ncbi:MAG: hypothetical protein HW388_120 [Dehalococcoidia bacterium]|nr:hypothetical protein [Dehalococcoidia bacterium]
MLSDSEAFKACAFAKYGRPWIPRRSAPRNDICVTAFGMTRLFLTLLIRHLRDVPC